MPSLHEVQQAMASAVIAGHPPSPAAGIAPDAPGAAERLAIYANHFRVTLIDALAATYPVVERLVGEPFFRGAARRYVQAYPPQSPCLFEYGEDFPAFLATLPELASLPFVADVARLEWAITSAASAPEGDASGGDASNPRLRLHPACGLVTSAFPVDRIWQAHQSACAEIDEVDITTGAARLLVHRRDEDVGWVSLPPADAVFVHGLLAHGCLDRAIAAAIATEAFFDPRPLLTALIEGGLLFVSPPNADPGES